MTQEVNLAELLDIDPDEGRISLWDYRMVLFSACALGALRKELIDTLGWDRARGLLKRFGYAAGLADGKALAERFPGLPKEEHMRLGASLHALEGVARVERIRDRSRVDFRRDIYHVEAYWPNSYEAEQHLQVFGPSQTPVCWNLAGYAAGHSTAVAGRQVLVVERECRAMGHEKCRFVADFEESFPSFFDDERADYQELCLPDILEDMQRTIDEQQAQLRSVTVDETSTDTGFGGMVGASQALERALEMARRVAVVDATVLITGESGAGKELLARGIYDHSPRSAETFLAFNCSVLPDNLQEAELFGYAKGAFTGATEARAGIFETANGGVLFLDEIGDLAPSAQTKLLRVLQEGEVKRLGENQIRKVDVRIIAATHRDLNQMVEAGQFRADLYYRLDVVQIHLPPLRDRENDTLILADHFLADYAQQFGKDVQGIDSEAKRLIARYPWPGNVRELRNAIERAVILTDEPVIRAMDLPDKLKLSPIEAAHQGMPSALPPQPIAPYPAQPYPQAAPAAPVQTRETQETAELEAFRRELLDIDDEAQRIKRTLRFVNGHREKAAIILRMGRTTLWRRMKQLGLD